MSNNTELKEWVVVSCPHNQFEIWSLNEYDRYISRTLEVGACPAYGIVTHFNGSDRLLSDSPSTCAGTWVRASERVPNHYRSVFARYTHDGKRCAWTIRYNPSMGHWITQGDEGIVDATDLEWLEENPHPGT